MGCLIIIVIYLFFIGLGLMFFSIPGAIIGAVIATIIVSKLNS